MALTKMQQQRSDNLARAVEVSKGIDERARLQLALNSFPYRQAVREIRAWVQTAAEPSPEVERCLDGETPENPTEVQRAIMGYLLSKVPAVCWGDRRTATNWGGRTQAERDEALRKLGWNWNVQADA